MRLWIKLKKLLSYKYRVLEIPNASFPYQVQEWDWRYLWYKNLNTYREFYQAERYIKSLLYPPKGSKPKVVYKEGFW